MGRVTGCEGEGEQVGVVRVTTECFGGGEGREQREWLGDRVWVDGLGAESSGDGGPGA